MTLQELRFIVTLAKEKHFGKAAAICFVSQPTLSIAVRKLEEELGVTLFERDKNDIKITSLGEQIVQGAKRVLEEAEIIKQIAAGDKDQLTGEFKLGAIYTVGPYVLPPIITELNKLAPGMPLEISENFTANLREKLRCGEIDAAIISLPFTEPGIVTKLLYKESFVVLMPTDHPLAKQDTIAEKNLVDYSLLMLGEGHCFREQVVSSCPSCFVLPKSRQARNWRTVEGSSLETIRHMVASGMGITILPMTAANVGPYKDKMLTVRPLRGALPSRSIVLAWRKSFPRIKAIDIVLKALSQCSLQGAIR